MSASKWNGQKLFKGAAPGTYWWTNDAVISGFTCAGHISATAAAAVTHIANYSHPSPYLSLSTSFAVAEKYAKFGPGGAASPANPGYVYEVDTTQAPCSLFDPVELISKAWLGHDHDGDQDLILGVASPGHRAILGKPPARLGGGSIFPPTVTPRLHALIFAIRDGEVFAEKVPKNCVVKRHPVY